MKLRLGWDAMGREGNCVISKKEAAMAKNKTQERVCSAVQCSAVQYLVFFFRSFLFLAAAVAVRCAALLRYDVPRIDDCCCLCDWNLRLETRRDDETTYQAGLEKKAEIDGWGIRKQ